MNCVEMAEQELIFDVCPEVALSINTDHSPIILNLDSNHLVSARQVSRQTGHARGRPGVYQGWRPSEEGTIEISKFFETRANKPSFKGPKDVNCELLAAAAFARSLKQTVGTLARDLKRVPL